MWSKVLKKVWGEDKQTPVHGLGFTKTRCVDTLDLAAQSSLYHGHDSWTVEPVSSSERHESQS